jgi:hypothetical protein
MRPNLIGSPMVAAWYEIQRRFPGRHGGVELARIWFDVTLTGRGSVVVHRETPWGSVARRLTFVVPTVLAVLEELHQTGFSDVENR